jgi:acyl carrier protein
MIPDFLLAKFRQIVGPERQHLIEPDAVLEAVGIDPADRLTLACAIDEALVTELPDAEVARWDTVADVLESVGSRGG